ncbi:hypothetical protein J132_05736 [Termitomyces sp. J132]|nr:hypothetical protein J132_05736 [Termitomyces sp. J132]
MTGLVDDRDPQIAYSGDWVLGGTSQEYHSTTHGSVKGSTGATATFSFTGSLVAVFGTISTPAVSTYAIDGSVVFTLTADHHTDNVQYKQQFFASDQLSNSYHTLVVTSTFAGASLWIDYFKYAPSAKVTTTVEGGSSAANTVTTIDSMTAATEQDTQATRTMPVISTNQLISTVSISTTITQAQTVTSLISPSSTSSSQQLALTTFFDTPSSSTVTQILLPGSSSLDALVASSSLATFATIGASSTSNSNSGSSSNPSAIVGGTVGGVIVFLLLSLLLLLFLRKRRLRAATSRQRRSSPVTTTPFTGTTPTLMMRQPDDKLSTNAGSSGMSLRTAIGSSNGVPLLPLTTRRNEDHPSSRTTDLLVRVLAGCMPILEAAKQGHGLKLNRKPVYDDTPPAYRDE